MSERSRRDVFGVVSASAVAVIVVLLVLTIWDTAVLQTESRLQSEGYATAYEEEASERIAEDCIMAQPELAACVERVVTAKHELQRAERDLRAQREMAQYAWGAVVVSGSGLFLTLVGIVYVARTLEATREGNRINQRNGRAQVRAYLTADQFQLCAFNEAVMGDRVFVRFFISNSGNSPARGVMIATAEKFSDSNVPTPFREDTLRYSFPGDIRAGTTDARQGHVVEGGILPDRFLEPGHFHMLVRLDYFDVFDDPQTETFLAHWEAGTLDIHIEDIEGPWFPFGNLPLMDLRGHLDRARGRDSRR